MADAKENGDDNDISTVSGSSEEGGEDVCKIDLSCRPSAVTWKTTDGQEQSTQNLSLDVYLDTSTNTAFFKLYGYIYLKKSRNQNRQAVYLFIYPENIQTVTWEIAHTASPTIQGPARLNEYFLCFSMSQPPSLVIPKDRVLESKNKTQDLLDSIQALARTTTFTAHIGDKDTDLQTRQGLQSVASAFSDQRSSRLLVNNERANLTTLYAGSGGEIVVLHGLDMKPSSEAGPPPSYNVALSSGQPSAKKRRRTSDPPSNISEPICSILKSICNKLDNIQHRLDKLEEQASCNRRCSCRYDTEERADLLQSIDDRVENSMLDVQFEMQDQLNDTIHETKGDIEQLKNDTQDTIKQLVDESVKGVLDNASLEFNGRVSLKL